MHIIAPEWVYQSKKHELTEELIYDGNVQALDSYLRYCKVRNGKELKKQLWGDKESVLCDLINTRTTYVIARCVYPLLRQIAKDFLTTPYTWRIEDRVMNLNAYGHKTALVVPTCIYEYRCSRWENTITSWRRYVP